MISLRRLFAAYRASGYWRYTFFRKETAYAFFAALGALQGSVSAILFFFPESQGWLSGIGWHILAISSVCTLANRRPRFSVKERLSERDVELEIAVADLFSVSGSWVISTNTTFDTDIIGGIIHKDSLQGQFTQKYYDSNMDHLDGDLQTELEEKVSESLPDDRKGKKLRYPSGTVVRLNPKNQTCYLVAVANMNKNGVAQTSFEEVKVALAEVWSFIIQNGEMEPIVIPIIGTGRGRVKEKREQIAKEILKSFVAACAEVKFCEKLTVVISPTDYRTHCIDLTELGNYLRAICLYTEFKTTGGSGEGIGVDEYVDRNSGEST